MLNGETRNMSLMFIFGVVLKDIKSVYSRKLNVSNQILEHSWHTDPNDG